MVEKAVEAIPWLALGCQLVDVINVMVKKV
jgi:hypothetical protein